MNAVTNDLRAVVAERDLLCHPLYKAWTAGELTRSTLRDYAAQYYRFVAAFPSFVSGVHSGCDDEVTRAELLENLVEEERGEPNHPELWLRFCDALGISREDAKSAEPYAETRELVDTFRRLTRAGSTAEGLAALFAYESQVPAVASAKIDGLKRFYAISADEAIAFFTVHQKLDVWHSQTCAQLIERHATTPAEAKRAVEAGRVAADALWSFLSGVQKEQAATR
jgi:pyrroloquinoline-quinone synthase